MNLRTWLRREGVRIRPRKTERGVEKQMEEYREAMKLAGLATKMGAVMKLYEEQQVRESAEEREVVGEGGEVWLRGYGGGLLLEGSDEVGGAELGAERGSAGGPG